MRIVAIAAVVLALTADGASAAFPHATFTQYNAGRTVILGLRGSF